MSGISFCRCIGQPLSSLGHIDRGGVLSSLLCQPCSALLFTVCMKRSEKILPARRRTFLLTIQISICKLPHNAIKTFICWTKWCKCLQLKSLSFVSWLAPYAYTQSHKAGSDNQRQLLFWPFSASSCTMAEVSWQRQFIPLQDEGRR